MPCLSQMEIFYFVARENSFSKAARSMGLSKSFVSTQITQLEKELNIKLLNRTTRFISLTEEGQIFYDSCSKIIKEKQTALALMSNAFDEPVGSLKITAPPSLSNVVLSAILPEYLLRYPKVTVNLETTTAVRNLAQYGIDIALRVTDKPEPEYIARPIGSFRIIICSTDKYLQEVGYPKEPKDLENYNCLTYTNDPNNYYWILRGEKTTKVKVKGSLSAINNAVIKSSLLAGLGVAMLPEYVVRKELQSKEVIELFPEATSQAVELYAVYQSSIRIPCKIKSFISFLKEKLEYGTDIKTDPTTVIPFAPKTSAK